MVSSSKVVKVMVCGLDHSGSQPFYYTLPEYSLNNHDNKLHQHNKLVIDFFCRLYDASLQTEPREETDI